MDTSNAEMQEVWSAEEVGRNDVVVHWQSAFGLVVIEVRDGVVYVNGDPVEPMLGGERACGSGGGANWVTDENIRPEDFLVFGRARAPRAQ